MSITDAIFGAAILFGAFVFPSCETRGLHREMQANLDEIRIMNNVVREDIATLQREIHAMQNNKSYAEHIIRDEIGWARKGDIEIVYAP